jgi:hypothetical protein
MGFGDSMKLILLLRTLSIVVHLPMLKTVFPGVTIWFFSGFLQIVQFNLIKYNLDYLEITIFEIDEKGQESYESSLPD